MAKAIIVAGKTGTGKSYSMRNLRPEETLIINVVPLKDIPFRGYKKKFNTQNRNFVETDDYHQIMKFIASTKANGSLKHIKTVVIDDTIYLMRNESFNTIRAGEKGYDKFNRMAANFQELLYFLSKQRADLQVVLMMHIEKDDDTTLEFPEYKLSSVGKLVDKQSNPLELVTVTLFTDVEFDDEEDEPIYRFITRRTKRHGFTIPAKSPVGMFEERYIDNDLQKVLDISREYYEEEGTMVEPPKKEEKPSAAKPAKPAAEIK